MSKAVTSSRVIPYLLGFEPRELQGPLSQFQAVRADQAGTLRLVNAVNVAQQPPLLSPELLEGAFQVWWPQLEPEIVGVAAAIPPNTLAPQRSVESMLGELLELTRARSLPVAEPESQRVISMDGLKLGNRLRGLRLRQGMTQGEIAGRVGVSQAYLSNFENGRSSQSLPVLLAIAKAFNVNLSVLADSSPEFVEESNTDHAT